MLLANFHFLCLPSLLLDGAALIAVHKARYYKRKDGLALGPGPFVTALEYATDTKATVVGKPEKTFFLEALRGTGCEPEEAVMIGDVSRKAQEMPAYLSCGQEPTSRHCFETSRLSLWVSDGSKWVPVSRLASRWLVILFKELKF